MKGERIRNFLETFKSDKPSHVLYSNNRQQKITSTKIKISPSNKAYVWNELYELSNESTSNDYPEFTVAEIPCEDMPLIFYFNLVFINEGSAKEYVSDDFFKKISEIIMEKIKDFGELTKMNYNEKSINKELISFIFKSDTALTEGENIELKYKVHFPFVRCTKEVFLIILNLVILELRKQRVRNLLIDDFIGDYKDIIRKDNYEINHFYYGFYGDEEIYFEISKIYIDIINPDRDSRFILEGDEDLSGIFNKNTISHNDISEESFNIDTIKDVNIWKFFFFSLGFNRKILLPKDEKYVTRTIILPQAESDEIQKNNTNEQNLVLLFLNMISPKRFQNEIYWIDIIEIIKTEFNEEQRGIAICIDYTLRNLAILGKEEPFSFMMVKDVESLEKSCEIIYRRYKSLKFTLTVKTLAWYAMTDNPTVYHDWHQGWSHDALIDAIDGNDISVAIAVYRVYWLHYVYVPGRTDKNSWLYFCTKTHKYVYECEGIGLKKEISFTFREMYENIQFRVTSEINNIEDETQKSELQNRLKKIGNLIQKLKNINFICSVIKGLCLDFNKQKFESILNSNYNLIGVCNGVFQVYNSEIIFRAGKPEDYIHMSCDCYYDQNMKMSDSRVKRLLQWLGKVFRQDDLYTLEDISDPSKNLYLRWFLKFSASILRRQNDRKLLPIFNGKGNNGKSMIVKLFSKLFGEYCVKMDITNLTSRSQNSSAASPQLARLKNTALTIVDEVGDTDRLHNELVKRLTGGDSFFVRGLFQDGCDIDITCKSIIICNTFPKCLAPDRATRRRIKVILSKGEWQKDAPKDINEQIRTNTYEINTKFEDELDDLVPAFLFVMVKFYSVLESEGLEDTNEIIEFTNEYWAENDIFSRFIQENILTAEKDGISPDSKIVINHVHSLFKTWYKETFPAGKSCPEKNTLEKALEERWGKKIEQGWKGVAFSHDYGNPAIEIKGNVLISEEVNIFEVKEKVNFLDIVNNKKEKLNKFSFGSVSEKKENNIQELF